MLRGLAISTAVFLGACAVAPADDGDARGGQTNPPKVTGPSSLSVGGSIIDYRLDAAVDAKVADAEVCLLDANGARCGPSAVDGAFWIGGVAANSSFELSVTKPGYVMTLAGFAIQDYSATASIGALSESTARALADAAGREHIAGNSSGVLFRTHTIGYDGLGPLSGVSVTVDGIPATYVSEDGSVERDGKSTSERAWAASMGLAAQVVDVHVSYAHGGAVCGAWRNGIIEFDHFAIELLPGTVHDIVIICGPDFRLGGAHPIPISKVPAKASARLRQ